MTPVTPLKEQPNSEGICASVVERDGLGALKEVKDIFLCVMPLPERDSR